jgi:alpha-tubulin suppressor-like RCC1 family protein
MNRHYSFAAALLLAASLVSQTAFSAAAKIATHGYFNHALDAAGNVWGWGDNDSGQLGKLVQSPKPVKVSWGMPALAAEAYGQNSLILDRDGGLWSFGENVFGQAGSGHSGVNATPVQILRNVSKFSLGEHGLAVLADGSLYAWGRNVDGELGVADAEVLSPRKVGSGYRDVAAGWGYSLALKSDGRLYSWGLNDCGQLGIGAPIGPEVRMANPTLVAGQYRAVAAGADHVVALATDGSVHTFGCNAYGQLGRTGDQTTPMPVAGIERIVAVVAGRGHSLALRDDGTLFAWGNNAWGELARSDSASSPTPVTIGTGFSSIGGKGEHVLAVKGGALWAWGRNHMTQTALDTDSAVVATANAVTVGAAGGAEVAAVAGGDAHSLAIDSEGGVWSWGDNRQGQLGVGLLKNSTLPLFIASGFKDVAVGYNHALGIDDNDSLWAWGSNLYGAMGDGTRIDRHTPVKIATGIAAAVAGKTESVMLKADGSVWQWGDSIGHRNDPDAPIIAPQLKDVGYIGITAGYTHFVGIKSDKSAWAWGSNGTCQLGNGGACMSTETPVKVGEGFVAVAAGQHHSVGLKENGELWGWGDNEDGQLGVGPAIIRTPVKIGTGFTQIAAGALFTVARKTNGELVGFGRFFNSDCQPLLRCDPVLLGADFNGMAGGHKHLLLLKADGTVYARGQNYSGELGDGTFVNRRSLALVVNPAFDGFLNLQGQSVTDVPAEYRVPFFVATAGKMTGARASLTVRPQFNPPDIGQQGAVFVTARAPKGTLPLRNEQKAGKVPVPRVGAPTVAKDFESDIFELLQLTSEGWLIVSDGELFPFVTGVFGELLDALTVLDGYDPVNFANLSRNGKERSTPNGTEFCVGYGTSASVMASTGLMRVIANSDDFTTTAATSGTCVVPSAKNGAMVPSAPREIEVSAGNGSATLNFSVPASNGGAAISAYNAVCTGDVTVKATGSSAPLTLTGLTLGATYSCTVTAANSLGSGPAAPAVSVTPTLSAPPEAPSNIIATAGEGSISVRFIPGALGSGTLLRYTVACAAGNASAVYGTGSVSPITVAPLTNGVAYTCRVKTSSSLGTSVWSVESNAEMPRPLPDLIVTHLTSASAVKAGSEISVNVSVSNRGSAEAAASRVEFQLLENVAIASSALAGLSNPYCDIPRLAPEQTTSCTATIRLPAGAPSGRRYWVATADFNGLLLESNETNNTRAASTPIQIGTLKKPSIIPSTFLLLAQ